MRNKFSLLVLLFVNILLAQNREDVKLGPEFKKIVDAIDACYQEENKDCYPLVNDLVQKGKREKVGFMDYLYVKKAFYFLSNSQIDSCMHYCKLSLKNLHKEEKFRADVEAYNMLGNCYYYKGDLNNAINSFIKVAEILENGGNPLHLGYLYSNIAILLGEAGSDKKQLEYNLKSYELLESNNDEKFIARVASNLGYSYFFNNDSIEAKNWANKALKLSEKKNDIIAKTQSYEVLAWVEKDPQKSVEYAQNAVKFSDELQTPTNQASAYYRLAESLQRVGNKTEALNYAEKAVQFAEEVGDKVILMKASLTAAKINFQNGNKARAADYYNNFALYNDSISSAEKTKAIHEIYTQYETEKKEKQIVEQELQIQKQRSQLSYALGGGALGILLIGGYYFYKRKMHQLKLSRLQQEKENAILNSFIQGEERERNRISQELHDNIAAMIGAAKMSLETIPHLPEEKQKEQLGKVISILDNTHADVRHIAHNLLPIVLEKDGLIKATQHFASEINDTKLLEILVQDEDSRANELSQQVQLMLFRIIQELINNIIKHSQAQQAVIHFSRNEKGLQIEVSDDGVGFDGELDAKTQGLYSISQRMKSIGGNFTFTRKQDRGMKAVAVIEP